VARYDLEIRGAGNLLGASQSGHIRAVGYDLYMELMEKAIREIKGEEVLEEVDPEIHLDMPAYIPESYIEDPTQRLQLYKRLASATSREDLEDLRQEVLDRYGPLPELVNTLFEVMHFKVELRTLRIREARFSDEGLMLFLDEHTPIPVERVLEWISREPERFRIFPDHRLWVRFAGQYPHARLHEGIELLAHLKDTHGLDAATH
jgi:transcription-repair coupling factor (superfamily II helicase)